MSGTSLDGIDICLIEVTGNSINTKFQLLAYDEFPFPDGFKEFTLKNSLPNSSKVDDICKLNFIIARIYSNVINTFLEKHKINKLDVDLIGTHGQTIHHLPQNNNMFGVSTASTLQIGDPSVLAKLTGIITVGDFRPADIALGGQGAPLVPYFDYLLFSDSDKNRALLNIGGISNITILPKNCDSNNVLAFDTGCGNMLIDLLTKKFFDIQYDKDSEIAKSGRLKVELLKRIIKLDNFINQPPPKSTGRELYNDKFLELVLADSNFLHEDIIHTFTYFTAYSIYYNYETFIKEKIEIDELYISGGGAKNPLLYYYINELFGEEIKISNTDKLKINSDAKESICFAILANETISGNTNNLPSVTGAKKKTIMGKICLP
ncbi:MAG TPA: anhydro-N-acetylmuramic acid kinase [Melioribacteraceae bacterium]|nr:anhydro-N-acetylmuramic acid kinase [Melioribacteraceae bacterium]